ncbi:c-type cytochrome [Sinobacterium caligoides]|nr:c-type cytochrome [Sinobacterium caligoides]
MRKIVLAASVLLTVMSAEAAEQATIDTYNKTCVICHGSGAAGAPKFAHQEDWSPRLAKGMPALKESVHKGLNAMPPMGMCQDCSDEDFEKLINYMSTGK